MLSKKLIVIGLSRTGTTTIHQYLRSRHLVSLHYPSKAQLYDSRYDSISDLPASLYFKDLDKYWKKRCNFLYLTRPIEDWVESVLWKFGDKPIPPDPFHRELRERTYGSQLPTREALIDTYHKHEEQVFKYFKDRPKDLLTMSLFTDDQTKSLNTLCEFIGIKNNGIPFPHANKRKQK